MCAAREQGIEKQKKSGKMGMRECVSTYSRRDLLKHC
jgi:hypothetical protein